MLPEFEFADCTTETFRYLRFGRPPKLCRWHSYSKYGLHPVAAARANAFVGDRIGAFKPARYF